MIAARALAALARKYEVMAALRASLPLHQGSAAPSDDDDAGELADAGEPSAADRARLRALAAEFPGALRELDTLETAEIARRRDALAAAAAGGAVADWMAWMDGYHALMRAALAIKRRLAGAASAAESAKAAATLATPVRDAIAADTGVAVDDAFVAAVAAPPHGRLNVVVFDRLAAATGIPAKRLWDALYPPRKGDRPYRSR
jgi:hypothetical protein